MVAKQKTRDERARSETERRICSAVSKAVCVSWSGKLENNYSTGDDCEESVNEYRRKPTIEHSSPEPS